VAIQLPYTDGFIHEPSASNAESKANKGAPNGYAPLDANAKVPTANLPNQINLSRGSDTDQEIYSGDGMGAPGGSIDLKGGNGGQDGHASSGGLIQLRGASGDDGVAGNAGQIIMNGALHDGHAGSIIANGATSRSAGSLNMSAFFDNFEGVGGEGGSINTSGGNTENSSGGSIDTSAGGGSISTRGTGSIELGITGTRTTLNGSASGTDKTITLPNLTGALPIALISASTSLDFGAITAGDFADLTISLIGAATTDVAFVTCLSSRGTTFGKLMFEAFVGSANNVTIRAHNPTSGSLNPDAYNFKVCVIKTS
jgi:hypothetical protein